MAKSIRLVESLAKNRVVSAVGIAVSAKSREMAQFMESAMQSAILDTIAKSSAAGTGYPSDDVLCKAQMDARADAKTVYIQKYGN